ncbi:MAG: DUF4173 domain-containing protein [Anaerolineaceae bacterium]|nr:DUF4173 domain-containing protein [Anaerolineaceae bacterium]
MSETEMKLQETPRTSGKEKAAGLPVNLPIFFLVGFAVAWSVDFLFWNKPLGVSFLIWTLLVLTGSFVLARVEGRQLDRKNLFLLIGIAACAVMSVLRAEPTTTAFNVLLTILMIGLLADHYLSATWHRFRIVDAVVRFVLLAFSAIERSFNALISFRSAETRSNAKGVWKRYLLPALRGVLISVPVLLVFAALLSSADPIFESYLKNFVDWLKIDSLPDFIFRVIYVLVLAFCFSGLYLHAFTAKRGYEAASAEQHWLKPFLGFGEGVTVMVLVSVLFAVFLGIQAQYFFGGSANIHISGYTYAEYARKGTNELILVSVLTLAMILALQAILSRNSVKQRRIFHILVSILILEVFVILVSSYQRLLLYEDAYGLTRIRVRTHVFIFWLAGLLIASVVLEWLRKSDRFFVVLLAASVGFVLSLGVVNVDGLIVRQNLARAVAGGEFDHNYLPALSADAIPMIAAAAQDSNLPDHLRGMMLAELRCRAEGADAQAELPWYARGLAEARAERQLSDTADLYADLAYQIEYGEYGAGYVPLSDGSMHYCVYVYDSMD